MHREGLIPLPPLHNGGKPNKDIGLRPLRKDWKCILNR